MDVVCAAVTPEVWGDNDHTVHSGIGTCVDKIYARTAAIAAAFHKDGYDIRLIGHSLGAACAGLLAWRFQQDGLERTRAIVYACPPCASPTLAQETQDYVLTVVMRYDAVPRLSPKTVVAMEEELLNISWEQMDATADEWGGFGRMLYRRAKCVAC
jgi:pimeloyl-ACP methyl ester carboxylesterase